MLEAQQLGPQMKRLAPDAGHVADQLKAVVKAGGVGLGLFQ